MDRLAQRERSGPLQRARRCHRKAMNGPVEQRQLPWLICLRRLSQRKLPRGLQSLPHSREGKPPPSSAATAQAQAPIEMWRQPRWTSRRANFPRCDCLPDRARNADRGNKRGGERPRRVASKFAEQVRPRAQEKRLHKMDRLVRLPLDGESNLAIHGGEYGRRGRWSKSVRFRDQERKGWNGEPAQRRNT